MIVWHISVCRNDWRIWRHGLSPRKAKGKLRSVWVVDSRRLEYAIRHISRRHQKPPEAMTVHMLDVDRSSLVRTHWRGIYRSNEHIPPACLRLKLRVKTVAGVWRLIRAKA